MMETKMVRAAVVGASTLLGKELAEQLSAAGGWDLELFDEDEAAGGQVTSAGDEALVLRTLEPGAFAAMDAVFFAASEALTRRHWKDARAAGAAVIDLTAALEDEAEVRIAAPWIAATGPDLTSSAVVSAHPAAFMLALVATRVRERFGAARMVVTLHEPASQHEKAGLDELQRQTAALLSFQSVPRDVFDAQTAFNLQTDFGPDAKVYPAENERRIREHFAALAGDTAMELQVVQAPVFNGYTASVFLELNEDANATQVREALSGIAVRITDGSDETPSNQSATEQPELLISVKEPAGEELGSRGFWLWMAADNLRFSVQNALACATELLKLRPAGRLQ